jgi:hypothetical protein
MELHQRAANRFATNDGLSRPGDGPDGWIPSRGSQLASRATAGAGVATI